MKPTQALLRAVRRYRFTTKTAPRNYYKGTRSGAMGEHTKHGGYIVNFDKVRTYVVPQGLKDFALTPFVTRRVTPMRGQYGSADNQPRTGRYYLNRWKEENGED